jgi:hypothetical protein
MDDLAAECDTLKRLLALHELDRARSWLAGALDMVDAARRVRDETKRTLRDALKHLGADVPLEADAAHALDDEEDGDATVSHDGSARDSDDDDEAAILPPQDMQLPDDDDAPFWVVPQVATEDANADIAMEAAETLSQLSKNKPAHTKRRKALSATETCGELGALIMMNFAIRSGRHEDSIPFSVITEAIDAAQKAAAEAEEAEEAARIAQALDIEEQATAASVAASAAGVTATDVTSLSDLIGLTPVRRQNHQRRTSRTNAAAVATRNQAHRPRREDSLQPPLARAICSASQASRSKILPPLIVLPLATMISCFTRSSTGTARQHRVYACGLLTFPLWPLSRRISRKC